MSVMNFAERLVKRTNPYAFEEPHKLVQCFGGKRFLPNVYDKRFLYK